MGAAMAASKFPDKRTKINLLGGHSKITQQDFGRLFTPSLPCATPRLTPFLPYEQPLFITLILHLS
jgi:hypothetical protein